MTDRLTAKQAGELLFDILASHPDGLSQTEILDATGMSRNQFDNGKHYLRGLFIKEEGKFYAKADDETMPYSYDPRANVYKLDSNKPEVADYWNRELRGLLMRLLRLLNGTGSPAEAKFGGRLWTRARRHTEGLIEDLREMIDAV